MKKVLFIAYNFPPAGGPGVQRTVKFVKHLPGFGWLPVVITTDDSVQSRWMPRDNSLLTEVPTRLRVYRSEPFNPSVESRWKERLCDLAGRPTAFTTHWQSSILDLGGRACREHNFDLILISMSPFQGAPAAAALARQLGIPWVADLRDPWALDEMQGYPTGFHRRLELSRMERVLAQADAIIMNTPESAKQLRHSLPLLREKRVVCITNGFDAKDFAQSAWLPNPKHFTIVHSGFLHTGMGLEFRRKRLVNQLLGRFTRGVDFLTRSHYYLLKALAQWVGANPALRDQVRLVLIGGLTEEDKRLVQNSLINDLVLITGYLPHEESVKWLAKADLLFLPMHNLSSGCRATIVPGKTYEYIASAKPILAAVPEGDARDFVTQAGTGLVCAPDDVEGMVRILRAQHEAWRKQEETASWNKSFVEQFERRKLTERLAEVLGDVVAAQGGPGKVGMESTR